VDQKLGSLFVILKPDNDCGYWRRLGGELNLISVFQAARILVCDGEFRELETIELGT